MYSKKGMVSFDLREGDMIQMVVLALFWSDPNAKEWLDMYTNTSLFKQNSFFVENLLKSCGYNDF